MSRTGRLLAGFPRVPHNRPRPPRAPPPRSSHRGLSRVASVIAVAAMVTAAARHPASAARAITVPLAITSPMGHRDQAETNDPLPWRIAEPIPHAVGGKVHGARGPEGRKRARHGSRKSPHLPPDETHHQDHVRPRDRLGYREKVSEFLIGHPAMGGDDEVAD